MVYGGPGTDHFSNGDSAGERLDSGADSADDIVEQLG
jgi:hypothetical protein